MKIPASHRNVAWLALLVIAPAVAGPGAIVATLAALAAFDGDHEHHVSVQQGVGHDDFVICHELRVGADSSEVAFSPVDCSDDHRVKAANIESLISRHDGANAPHDALIALVVPGLSAIATDLRASLPASVPATLAAQRHQRTVVLRI